MHSRPDWLMSNYSSLVLPSAHSLTMLRCPYIYWYLLSFPYSMLLEIWIISPWTLPGTMLLAR